MKSARPFLAGRVHRRSRLEHQADRHQRNPAPRRHGDLQPLGGLEALEAESRAGAAGGPRSPRRP